MSTAYVQARLKTIAEIPRFPDSLDPELLLDRISLIHDIELCYRRGLITWIQFKVLELWLSDGFVHDRYALLAALEAIATVSGYTDAAYLQNHADMGLSEEELAGRLFELSENLTVELDWQIKEEPTTTVQEM